MLLKKKLSLLALVGIFLLFCATNTVKAQNLVERGEAIPTHFQEESGDRALMTAIILQRLTIWTRPSDGRRIFVSSCRNLRHGCEQQITTMVDYIFDEAQSQNYNAWLLASMAWRESRFNPFAVSNQGAYGILQFLRRGVWSRGLRFVRQPWYRERCRRELGSCQRPMVERAIYYLKLSQAQCSSLQGALRVYNSGSCRGPRRYPRAIFNIYDDFLERAQIIRENNFVDPERPQDGPVYIEDDCAEQTLEEVWCTQSNGSCNIVGVREECLQAIN